VEKWCPAPGFGPVKSLTTAFTKHAQLKGRFRMLQASIYLAFESNTWSLLKHSSVVVKTRSATTQSSRPHNSNEKKYSTCSTQQQHMSGNGRSATSWSAPPKRLGCAVVVA
jgi:hypothetical protein